MNPGSPTSSRSVVRATRAGARPRSNRMIQGGHSAGGDSHAPPGGRKVRAARVRQSARFALARAKLASGGS